MKVARTVWSGGKVGDDIKGLPITIMRISRRNEKRFEQLSQDYESEQAELEKQTAELKAELAQFDSDSLRADKFMELAKRYTDFSELTPAILHEFVEKVVVHEADRSSGRREQLVDIYLNYIGQFDVPEEIESDAAGEEQRAKWREYKRKERGQKRKAAIAAEQKTA